MPTKLPEKGDPETLYLIDISGYIFRAYHALPPLSSSRGEPTHAVRGVASMLLKLIEDHKPAQLAVAVDAHGESFRKKIFPEYKANRTERPPDLSQQIARVMELIEALQIPALEVAGCEADDVIATVVKRCRQTKRRVVIVSADKDLLQLVGDGVVMHDTMRERTFGPEETVDKFGVGPELVRDLLALTGDSSDNIPGVPSIGPKTAAKLLGEYGSFDGVYEHVEEIKRKSWKSKLIDNRDQALLSRELVTLKDDLDVKLEGLAYEGGDRERLRALFAELEFTQMIAQLEPAPTVAANYQMVLTEAELDSVAAQVRDSGHMAIESVLTSDDPLDGALVGLAMSPMEGVGFYIPVEHRYIGAPDQLSMDVLLGVLRPLLENSLLPKTSSDLKREDLVWRKLGVALRGGRFDVGLASYLLDPSRHSHGVVEVARMEMNAEIGIYDPVLKAKKGKRPIETVEIADIGNVAAQHADFALRLRNLVGPRLKHGDFRALYEELELPLSRVLADMERVGVRVDDALLKQMSAEAGKLMVELEQRAYEAAGREFNLGSPKQLEGILFDELGLPVVKRTKTSRSTDADVLEELKEKHPLPELVLEWRNISKLKGTYLDALPKAVSTKTGRIHTRYNQTVAETGRLSSSNPNLQNIPIRTEMGRKVRDAFVPADGFTLLAADYSQIELRVLAHLSEDAELLDAFNKAEDVHVRTATALFEVKGDEVTRDQRGQAKTVNYAVIYGQTQWALARNLGISKTEAKRYIDAFFARYSGVARYMEELITEARTSGYVTTMLGRRRPIVNIRSRNPALRGRAEREARNTPIQGTAADIIKLAMVRIHDLLRSGGFRSRMILTVHDELVFEVDNDEKERVAPLILDAMQGAMALAVPLVVDMGWGANWGTAH